MAGHGALDRVLDRLDQDFDASLDRLKAIIAIPSVSTEAAFAGDCRRAAEWVAADLAAMGFEASVRDTPGHPMVVGHLKGPDGSPHVLFYGHYDVQPVDPLNLWDADPFKAEVIERDGVQVITGRGSADDKGQFMTFLEAARAWIAETGGLPLSVTVLIEGEEEASGINMAPFLKANAEELKADLALVCDTDMWDAETPAVSATLRGLVGEEVIVTAADRDLHSGHFGGAAQNPIHILARILADLHDDDGRVTIPGFYDGVEEVSNSIRAKWADLGLSDEDFLGVVGLKHPSGERGRSALELTWARPTAEVNGISGGYEGDGFKTVIASKAFAKLSFRLVGKQDPHKIRDAFREFVRARIPADCSVAFAEHGAGPAIDLGYEAPLLEIAKGPLSDEWGKPCAVVGMGGSIPVVADFRSILGMETLLVGFGLADDRIHSPNEKYNLSSFRKGQRSWARIIAAAADMIPGAQA